MKKDGSEAMFVDLGHFSKRSMKTAMNALWILSLLPLSAAGDEFSDFGEAVKPKEELDPGSWRLIFEPDSAAAVDHLYYSAVRKMLAAASSGDPMEAKEAATEIEAVAAGGCPHAQSVLGFMYRVGMMREQNRAKAFLYHSFAADEGNMQSKMALAYMDSSQDMFDKAVALYAELAEVAVNSFLTPRYSLIRIHIDAEENKESLSKYREEEGEDFQMLIYQAEKGNAEAMNKIGKVYHLGLRGVRRDHVKAMSWLLKAVEKGEPRSMELLGQIYARGTGVERNYTKALEWLTLASRQQLCSAYSEMGYLYFKGYGVEKNYTKAKEYFEKAVDNEGVGGHYYLGVMYLKGVGVTRNEKVALRHFIQAANGGQEKAYYQMAKMFHTGVELKKNLTMAISLYKLVAEQGPWSSLSRWAVESYLKGDVGKALLLYSRMAELGYEVAQSNAA